MIVNNVIITLNIEYASGAKHGKNSEYGKVLNSTIWLNMSEQDVNMPENV